MKAKDGAERQAYTVRLLPDALKQLKHLSVDDGKTVGELIEEGIILVMRERQKAAEETKTQAKASRKARTGDPDRP